MQNNIPFSPSELVQSKYQFSEGISDELGAQTHLSDMFE